MTVKSLCLAIALAAGTGLSTAALAADPIVFDKDSAVSQLYHVSGMPTTVLIDRKGVLRWVHRSYAPGDENEYLNQVRAALMEK